MKDTIFREYDIRGIVGEELILANVYDLTQAILFYLKQKSQSLKTIVVGIDGRTHSQAIKDAVLEAAIESGIDVLFIGICPSPVLYFALHTQQVDGGIMITASHNPKEYNGMKICLKTDSVWGEQIQEIRNLYQKKVSLKADMPGVVSAKDIIPLYIAWLVHHFESLVSADLRIVFDCGNGVAGVVMPELIKAFQWKECTLLYPEIDGDFPHHEADPVVEKNMRDVRHILETTNSELGIGFDGDADRVGVMTKEGELLSGDKLLALFVQEMIKINPHISAVYNILGSAGLLELLDSWGVTVHMVPAGHSSIKEAMKQTGAAIGGESSCHFFFSDRHFGYDDGIYAALRVCEIVKNTQKKISELLSCFPVKISSREYRISCSRAKAFEVITALTNYFKQRENATVITIDGVRATLPYGWGIVRKANTQDVLSMRFEANDREGFETIKQEFITVMRPFFETDALKEIV